MVAAIIESLTSLIALRKEKLHYEAVERKKKMMLKIHSTLLASQIICRGGIDRDSDGIFHVYQRERTNCLIDLES